MYNPKHFEEVACSICVQGMEDYEGIVEQILINRYEDCDFFLDILDEVHEIFAKELM